MIWHVINTHYRANTKDTMMPTRITAVVRLVSIVTPVLVHAQVVPVDHTAMNNAVVKEIPSRSKGTMMPTRITAFVRLVFIVTPEQGLKVLVNAHAN